MLTVLIPFLYQNSYRIRNLTAVVNNFRKHYPDFEVLIAEQNATGVCDSLVGGNVRHVSINLPYSDFNKCMVMNTAIRENINGNVLMMCDADCVLPPIDRSVFQQALTAGSIFFPFTDVNFLNEAHTRSFIKTNTFTQATRNQDLFINRYTGLVNVFTRDTFEAVGGFDPEFVNWGGEDDAFVDKCKRIVSPIYRIPESTTILHLYHPKVDTSEYKKTECFTWNKKRVATIRRMSDSELTSYISDIKSGVPDALNNIMHKYDADGKLSFAAKIKVGSGYIDIDTTVYNIIPVNGIISLHEILQCVYDTDGAGFLKYIMDLIDERITTLSDDERIILNHFKSFVKDITM